MPDSAILSIVSMNVAELLFVKWKVYEEVDNVGSERRELKAKRKVEGTDSIVRRYK